MLEEGLRNFLGVVEVHNKAACAMAGGHVHRLVESPPSTGSSDLVVGASGGQNGAEMVGGRTRALTGSTLNPMRLPAPLLT